MRFLRVFVWVVLFVSVFANIVMYMKWSGKRPIFSVNGEGVSRRELDGYLEVRYGPQYKAQLVQNMVVEQEAKKQGVWPSDQEIKDAFNEQKENSWQFSRQIQQAPWAADEAKREIAQTLARTRLLVKDVQTTPDQLKDEYNAHPEKYDTPNKAHTEFAIVMDGSRVNDVKQLLEKQINPTVIMQDLKGAVQFIGDENKLTVQQPFNSPKTNQVIFSMKPNEVKALPPGEFQRAGAKAVVVRLIDIAPGHKADLNDPKVQERMRIAVAGQRAKPWQEYFSNLWANTKFDSEDPNDKKIVEMVFFPDRARAAAAAR